MQFYHDMNTSLLTYVTNMNKAIEARAFFGMRTQFKGGGKQFRLAMKKFTNDQREQYKADMEAMRVDFAKYRESLNGMDEEAVADKVKEKLSTMRAAVKALQAQQHKA
jgi:hypothetical protein